MKRKMTLLSLLTLILITASFLFLASSGPTHPAHADAASLSTTGCENNPTQVNGVTLYACSTLAQPCLTVKAYPSPSAPTLGCLPYNSSAQVYCQKNSAFSDGAVEGDPLWDNISWTQTNSLAFVSDVWVSTSPNASPIPTCFFGGA